MTKISGIFAATMSVLNSDLSLNIEKTIDHAEKLIDQGCHGTAIFGSTGQAQLIPISEKIDLLNQLSKSKYKDKHLIGTGLNSLGETINFMKIANSLNFKKFLIMPPAYYKYGDSEVIEFYSKIIESVPECKIILYNFEKLCGYKFSIDCVKELVKKFPNQIVGVKFLHGVTDAPPVDVYFNRQLMIEGQRYGEENELLEITPGDYNIGIMQSRTNILLASFTAPLSGFSGSNCLILASGFMNPADNDSFGFEAAPKLFQFISLSIAPATIMMGVSFHLSKRYGSRFNGMLIILSGIIVLVGMVYAYTMIEDLKPDLVDSAVEITPLIFICVSFPIIIIGSRLLKTRPRKPKKNYLEDDGSF